VFIFVLHPKAADLLPGKPTMETSFSTSPSSIDRMASPPNFLKLEDLDASSPQPTIMDTQGTPAPVIVHSKPAKKRKSWGQELPEPKTALPPRKRAKTEDEKEQRRIERIKRNRAAAHNSRERKRQEADTLAVELAKANAVLDAYKRIYGPLPETVVLPQVTLCTTDRYVHYPTIWNGGPTGSMAGYPRRTTSRDVFS
jgi:transcriptional activator HAC1